jgi:tetratricopeptide (TPR) repeat protein
MARQLALALYYKRDFTGAENALAQARVLEPNAAGNAVLQQRIDETVGRIARSLDAANRGLELSAGGGVPLRITVIRLTAMLGRREEAEAHLAKLQKELEARKSHLSSRDLGYIELALGKREVALDLLGQAINERDTYAVWFGVDPRLDPLRGDPQFRQLLTRIGLPTQP